MTTTAERAKEVAEGIATRLVAHGWVETIYPMIVKDWQNAIAKAISDAECETEERCYAASEELCAKIAEMHDEIERLRTLLEKD